MSDFDRRRFLKCVLGQLAQTAGTIVVAVAAASTAQAQPSQEPSNKGPDEDAPPGDPQKRADRLAANEELSASANANEFLNTGFRNTPIGGFGNTPFGGFRNTPLGAFRNGPNSTFRNGILGNRWGNGGWGNGGWPNGFQNGGWPNGPWRNW
jgi:hypothetical protein